MINIKTKNTNYQVIINKNFFNHEINKLQLTKKKIYIIIDKKISHLLKKLKTQNNLNIIQVPGGEKIKSFNYYEKIATKILKQKVDRSSCIIAIGGGTICDLSGFLASSILRGIDFILMPTTLLSQVDASVGGKNGINSKYGKNLIGTFYQPNKVIIDISFLESLSKREIKSGYAEIFKHALIKDVKFYKWLCINYKKILDLQPKYIKKAIAKSIEIKSYFITKDENEKLINLNSRAILNFGHTFGHALETIGMYNNQLTHGEAISVGMSLASQISREMGLISNDEYNAIIDHFDKVDLPFYDKRINYNKFYNLMLSDKKNTDGKINLILLKKIGKAYFEKGFRIKDIKKLLK